MVASHGRGGSAELAGLNLIAALPLRGYLRSFLPKLLAAVAFLALSLSLTILPAEAAAPAPAGSTGYDISWPQCPSSFPPGGSFGIVGVTNGLAFSANPCLRNEYTWASGRPYAAGLYMNTGNPETASSNWPGRAGVGPRTCSTANLSDPSNVDCAYNYGWNAATDALNVATSNVGSAARTLSWWLDVEIGNSWNGTAAANSSTVQGYIDYVRSQATSTIGIYSTGYQWGQITGGYTVASAPDWLAGASSVSQAAGMCGPANSFSGGPVQLVQYPSGGFDGNYVCDVSPPPPDYSFSATPSSQTVTPGAGTSYTVNITRTGGFSGAVTLSSSVQPSTTTIGISFSNPNPTTGNTSTMSVTTGTTTPTGSYTLTITGTAGGAPTHTTTVALTVQAPQTGDYSLSATPSSRSITRGTSARYTVTIARTGGFTGAVAFSVNGLPSGSTFSFSPNPSTGTTTSLKINSSQATPAGTYVLTITGVSGSLTRGVSVTLIVTASRDCNNC